jgi:hypothetical protein
MPSFKHSLILQKESNLIASGILDNQPITVLHQPSQAARIKATMTGAGEGTLTITGTVNGVPNVQEILSFTYPRWLLGTKLFTAISSIVPAGFAEPYPIIVIQSVNDSGNALSWIEEEEYPCDIRPIKSSQSMLRRLDGGGVDTRELFIVRSDEEIPIKPNDRFTIEGSQYGGDDIIYEAFSSPKLQGSVTGDVTIEYSFYAVMINK